MVTVFTKSRTKKVKNNLRPTFIVPYLIIQDIFYFLPGVRKIRSEIEHIYDLFICCIYSTHYIGTTN